MRNFSYLTEVTHVVDTGRIRICHSRERGNLSVGGNALYMSLFAGMRTVDLDTWETYTPTVQDNHDACKIADGLEYVHASTSYTPYCELEGVPPAMLVPTTTWSRLKYFSKISRVGTTHSSHIWEIQMAQALGETAPLLMIGMVAFIVDVPASFTDPATALPVQIYLWADSPERAFAERTAAAIIVLLGFLLLMNLAAVILRHRMERRT